MTASDQRLSSLVRQLQQTPGLAEQLPAEEGAIVREAVQGRSVYAIAQQHQASEEAVWTILSNAARMAGGQPARPQVETGGLGSDTDPGVTGGYGDTGFGSLGNEPPFPTPEEPPERK
jgi:DNA-binding CsgD family transcriptional regulator